MSDKFALKWNDFQSNWNQSLSDLRKDTDFADVTLISDDKMKFLAHKILLSSCSNTFKMILKENSNSKSLLYLGGVSSVNLGYLLEYIYHGEVNLYQGHLDSFLESARNLEIEGLIGQESTVQDQESLYENEEEQEEHIVFHTADEKHIVGMDDKNKLITRRQSARPTTCDVAKIDMTSFTSDEAEEKIKELYERVDGEWRCLTCDYTTTNGSGNVKRHVETHIIGLSYSCNLCHKEFRLKNSLNFHKYNVHTFFFQDKKFLKFSHQHLSQIIFRNTNSLLKHLARNHQGR